ALADRHRDGPAGVAHPVAALQPFGRRHRDGAHAPVAEVLLDLEGQVHRLVLDEAVDRQGGVDRRERVRELDVDDRADDLDDRPRAHVARRIAAHCTCPPAISRSSCVIRPWRSLLYSSVRSAIIFTALSVAAFIETILALCSLAFAFTSTTWTRMLR